MINKTIAVVIAFNDLSEFHGGSLNGIKARISYFDQFLILYQSIVDNWQKENFDYNIYVLHSLDFSSEKMNILKKLDIEVLKVSYEKHKTKIRPMCYKVDIDCDFRLVLDVDMYAVKEPNFNFKYDIQAMYGGNKYNRKQWKRISKHLGCNMPKYKVRFFKRGHYNNWSFKEHYLYNIGKIKDKVFPFFNNGAILIRNEICPQFIKKWESYRALYTEFVKNEFKIDIKLEGQDVIGLAIDNTTSNWNALPRGVNFINQEQFELGKRLLDVFEDQVYLFHYINLSEKSKFYPLINNAYSDILDKYYN